MGRMTFGLYLATTVAASIALTGNANAKAWSVCNRTTEELEVAIAYREGPNQFISKGWHILGACSSCVVVMNYDRTEYDTVYVYAKNRAGEAKFTSSGASSPRFCIQSGAFTIRNETNSRCSSGTTAVGFQRAKIPNWERDYNLSLT